LESPVHDLWSLHTEGRKGVLPEDHEGEGHKLAGAQDLSDESSCGWRGVVISLENDLRIAVGYDAREFFEDLSIPSGVAVEEFERWSHETFLHFRNRWRFAFGFVLVVLVPGDEGAVVSAEEYVAQGEHRRADENEDPEGPNHGR